MPSTSTVLSGLALTANIARDAADGVPVVKQILGIVSQILAPAEKLDREREALHALAKQAQTIADSIKAAVADRELRDEMLCSLERIHSALRAVKTLFEKQCAKKRIRKALGYLFTVPSEVARLEKELTNGMLQFLMVAGIDGHLQARDNARSAGNLRLIRDYEVERLDLITTVDCSDGQYKYHQARVDGCSQLLVVRYFGRSPQTKMKRPGTVEDEQHKKIRDSEKILEEISTVRKSHPNVTYLYGRSMARGDGEFVVLRSGIRMLAHLRDDTCSGLPLSMTCRMASKVSDAAFYLSKLGAQWIPPCAGYLVIDEMNEPKIGLNDFVMSQPASARDCITMQVSVIQSVLGGTALEYVHRPPIPPYWGPYHALAASGFLDATMGSWICRGEITTLLNLSDEPKAYLKQADVSRGWSEPFWGQFLLDIALGQSVCGSHTVQVNYSPQPGKIGDRIQVRWIADDGDMVWYQLSNFVIPYFAKEEIRKLVGLPAASRPGGPCFLRYTEFAEGSFCTGWLDWLSDRQLLTPDRVTSTITGGAHTEPLD